MKTQLQIDAPAQNVSVGLTTIRGFELAQRAANLLASSSLVPERYRGNLADCVVALNMAQRMGADPLMVMQNLYVVHGTPAWSAQMLISVWNQCGRYTSIRYVFAGEEGKDSWGCKAVSTERETKEIIEGAMITIGMAKAEGWLGKRGSKWQTMPEQMLRYRAAAWLVRANAPELAMGFQTTDELHEVYDATPDRNGSFSVSDAASQSAESKIRAAAGINQHDQSGLQKAFDESTEKSTEKPAETTGDKQEWPRRQGDGWADSRGLPFDARVHGMTAGGVPSVNTHGAYRMRRGCDQTLHAQVEQELIAEVHGSKEAAEPPADDHVNHEPAAPVESVEPGPSASDIALAIRRCTSTDDCDDVEDMLRDADINDDIEETLVSELADRRERINELV